MQDFMRGLAILQDFIQLVDQPNAIGAQQGRVTVGPTSRRMPFDAVRAMADLGWRQTGDVPINVNTYDPSRAWVFDVKS